MADQLRSEVAHVKYMPIGEFVDGGYLQEVNRRLLHPLGLALEVQRATQNTRVLLLTDASVEALRVLIRRIRIDPNQAAAMDALEGLIDSSELLEPGDSRLSGIWDCRDDPEGVIFGDGVIDREKARGVTDEMNLRALSREATLGYVIQPTGEEPRDPGKPREH